MKTNNFAGAQIVSCSGHSLLSAKIAEKAANFNSWKKSENNLDGGRLPMEVTREEARATVEAAALMTASFATIVDRSGILQRTVR